MTPENERLKITFCSDAQLSYEKYQTQFLAGQAMRFDESYRLAHLSLVAPNHPRIIKTKAGTSYNNGIHDLVYSIAIPIDTAQLFATHAFRSLRAEVENSSFSHKLSWETFSQRENKLHATICSAMSTQEPPNFEEDIYTNLREIGPVAFKVSGVFSGNINIGRLYLKVYPQLSHGKNCYHSIQQAFGSATTDLYVVGLFNFLEELSVEETQDLNALLKKWQHVEFLQMQVSELWVLGSRDDLVLDGGVYQVIRLV